VHDRQLLEELLQVLKRRRLHMSRMRSNSR
jgi:hypothetical protein